MAGGLAKLRELADPAMERIQPAAGLLDVDRLLADAKRDAGLDDFGPTTFRDGLEELLASLQAEADLTRRGHVIWAEVVSRLLRSRLRARDHAKKSEFIDFEAVDRPLFVVGLPCSGVDEFADLLALDPLRRTVAAWEADVLAPPPTLDARGTDPRQLAAISRTDRDPEQLVLAPRGPVAPADCAHLLATSFTSTAFSHAASIPGYGRWFDEADAGDAYALHRRHLQLLATSIPTTGWSLHSDQHLWHLDAIRVVYPDAVIVWMHRDPATTIAEAAGRVVGRRRMVSGAVDHAAVVDELRGSARRCVDRATEALEQWDPAQVFHLKYPEVAEDGVGAVERLHRHVDLPLEQVGARRMQAWIDARPMRPNGAQLDTDLAEAVRAEFADYRGRYAVPS